MKSKIGIALLASLVGLACHRSNFLLGKLARTGLDAFLFICKFEVHQITAIPSISINASS